MKAPRLPAPSTLVAGALVLAAVLVRLWHDLEMSRTPFFVHPGLDAEWHDEWARQIIAGNAPNEAYFRAPGYGYFLAAIYRLFGTSPWPIHLVQALLGGLTTWLVYRLGRRLYGRTAGRVAGALAAFYGPLIYFDGELLAPSLAIPIFLFALHLTLRARTPLGWATAGVIFGLGADVLPNALGVVLLLSAILMLRSFIRKPRTEPSAVSVSAGGGPARTTAMALLPFVAGVLLAVAPVVLRNMIVAGDVTGIASQGGVNFYAGNNPQATGTSVVLPQFDRQPGWREFVSKTEDWASKQAGRRLKPSEVSSFYTRKGLDFWREQPIQAGRLLMWKLYYLLNGHEIPNNRDLYSDRGYSRVLAALMGHAGPFHFPLGLILPLAVMGLCMGLSRDSWPLYVFVAAYSISVLLFFVTERYRLPIVPVLLVYASLGLTRLARRERPAIFPSVLAGLVLVIANTHMGHAGDSNPAQETLRLGEAYFEARDFRRSAEEFERAFRMDPRSPEAPARLGAALQEMGDFPGAAKAYSEATALGSKDPMAWFNLGTLNLALGRLPLARLALEGAVQRDPDFVNAWINLGIVEASLGDAGRARLALDKALSLDPGNLTALMEKGRLLASVGDAAGARAAWTEALKHDSQSSELRLNLGLLAFEGFRLDEAKKSFEAALASNPSLAAAHFHLARVAAKVGDLREMIQRLEMARKGGFPLAGPALGDPVFDPYRSNPAFLRFIAGRS